MVGSKNIVISVIIASLIAIVVVAQDDVISTDATIQKTCEEAGYTFDEESEQCLVYTGDAYVSADIVDDVVPPKIHAIDCPSGCAQAFVYEGTEAVCWTDTFENRQMCEVNAPSPLDEYFLYIAVGAGSVLALAIFLVVYCFCCKKKIDDNDFMNA